MNVCGIESRGGAVILDDFLLPSRANQHWFNSGMDSPSQCLDVKHFDSYRHKVEYRYNSRGFRDQEWPEQLDELRRSIWCIGDSFTEGLGQPLEHTWPRRLQQRAKIRTINISMDGASNDWIARRALAVIQQLAPCRVVVMWSFIHRREAAGPGTDEDRRVFEKRTSDNEDWANFRCARRLLSSSGAELVELAIPDFAPGLDPLTALQQLWHDVRADQWPVQAPLIRAELESLPAHVIHELQDQHHCLADLQNLIQQVQALDIRDELGDIVVVPRLDRARDGFHFDRITADWVVEQILPRLPA